MKLILTFCFFFLSARTDNKTLFDDGLKAYNQGAYKKAIDNFSKSYALKKHSKISYYIAVCYFKMAEDLEAGKFAKRAATELPKLEKDPYMLNIQRIQEYCTLAPKFRKVHFGIVQGSRQSKTAKEKSEEKKAMDEFDLLYPNTAEGQDKLKRDWKLVEHPELLKGKKTPLNEQPDHVVDSLD